MRIVLLLTSFVQIYSLIRHERFSSCYRRQSQLRLIKNSNENEHLPTRISTPLSLSTSDKLIDSFCRFMNDAFRNLTIEHVRSYVAMIPSRSNMSFIETITTPPQYPGVPRPVSLTIIASIPTFLGWYGYYKFSVEEELFYDELQNDGKVSGCGGYGTLLPFVFLVLIGATASVIPVVNSISQPCIEVASIWILLGQINLYRRVNELYKSRFDGEEPLHAWWAILPPPLDVVVGLRQVHFLAKYWALVRGEELKADAIAETYFPFISSERFTLKEFIQQPRRWFWFTKDSQDFF
jgi:hypothetical protein